jgi:hypothetical protein
VQIGIKAPLKPDGWKINKKKLEPGFPVFRKAFLTVNWSPFGGFEGHFTFLTTI